MLNIGPQELILILIVALVVVGPQRLPELGRTIGKALREFRKIQDDVKDLVNTGMGDDFKQTTAELKRSAADLKSATDGEVGLPQRSGAARTRPHRSAGLGCAHRSSVVRARPVTPAPDADVPEPASADVDPDDDQRPAE